MFKSKLLKLFTIFCFIILINIMFSGCIDNDDKNSGLSFNFALLDGSDKNINEYQGKIVLIDFFGVTCPPCQYQLAVLAQIYQDYKGTNLEIISIDVWTLPPRSETPEMIEELIAQAREQDVFLDWTFGIDDSKGTLFNKYIEGNGVPMLYLLDENGNVYYSKTGLTDYSTLVNKIEELI